MYFNSSIDISSFRSGSGVDLPILTAYTIETATGNTNVIVRIIIAKIEQNLSVTEY
jgi:hypothetical protein